MCAYICKKYFIKVRCMTFLFNVIISFVTIFISLYLDLFFFTNTSGKNNCILSARLWYDKLKKECNQQVEYINVIVNHSFKSPWCISVYLGGVGEELYIYMYIHTYVFIIYLYYVIFTKYKWHFIRIVL